MTHLTHDEIDLWLEAGLSPDRGAHLLTCAQCAREASETLLVVQALAALPQLAPEPGFAERVMSGVRRPAAVPAAAPVRRARSLAAPRRAWAAATAFACLSLVSTAVAAVWGISNPATLATATQWSATQAATWLAPALRGLGTTLSTFAWEPAVQSIVASPQRAAGLAALTVSAYLVALFWFSKLMRPSRRAYAPAA